MHREQYIHKLQSRGYEMLGSGLYSSVLAVPNTNRVIKVGQMDAWPEYILWATRNGHAGKFAPMVYSLKFHGEGFSAFYVAIMERLVCTMNEAGYKAAQYRVFNNMHNPDCEATEFRDYIRELHLNRLSGDLHGGNIMIRHDGSLVVTDPISGNYSGTDRPRIKSGTCL